MNPQPDQSTVNFVTFIFVAMVIYFAVTTKKRFTISDKFDLIYEVPSNHSIFVPVENTIVKTNNKVTTTQKPKTTKVPKPKAKPQPAPQPAPQPVPQPVIKKKEFTNLQNDCKEALMSLGTKKKDAIDTVIKIFSKHNITSIEEFIKKAFAPNEYN